MALLDEIKQVASTAATTVAATATAAQQATQTTTAISLSANTTTSSESIDIHTQTKAEEEEEKKKKEQKADNNTTVPVWYQISNYESEDEDDEVTEEDISNALNKIVKYELSEAGNDDTLYYSTNYNEGFTHNGKIVNGSCTEGGMKKAILGGSEYITVTDKDGVTKSGVEAMADSYDSVLDLLTQSQFQKVLAEYGAGTFTNNNNFLAHADEIREKYGIDIKEVSTQNLDGSEAIDGISHRTFEISLVDENGKIIEDADGNKSTILFGDWVIPDGTAQGAEFDFISVIDECGFDCVSKADFIDNEAFASNPEFQDENGNYDAGKAYAYVISQLENDFNNMKSGGEGQYMKSGEQTINEATYVGSTFTWWSAGGSSKYYSNSGLDSSLTNGSFDINDYDLDGDGELSEAELAIMEKDLKEKDETEKEESDKEEKETSATVSSYNETSQGGANLQSVAISFNTVKDLNKEIGKLQDKNSEAEVKDIINDYAEENGLDSKELLDAYKKEYSFNL